MSEVATMYVAMGKDTAERRSVVLTNYTARQLLSVTWALSTTVVEPVSFSFSQTSEVFDATISFDPLIPYTDRMRFISAGIFDEWDILDFENDPHRVTLRHLLPAEIPDTAGHIIQDLLLKGGAFFAESGDMFITEDGLELQFLPGTGLDADNNRVAISRQEFFNFLLGR